MLFHDLDEDVLAQILVSSDIYAVLSFLRVRIFNLKNLTASTIVRSANHFAI
jgi:hypothetical protein